jgi:hypothetical protein
LKSIPFAAWKRYHVHRGLVSDLVDLYAMPGVVALRILPGCYVEVCSSYTAAKFPLLAHAFTHGRVELVPDDGRGPKGGAA